MRIPILVTLSVVYFFTFWVGLIMLVEGIQDYIYYKKKALVNPLFKSNLTTAKKQSRTALILLIFGPFFLLFTALGSIIRSIPKRPKSLAIFWDAIKDIFFKF